MRFSRLGVLALLTLTVLLSTNCSYYNRILSRKSLVDGSEAYKARKFQAAEDLFRQAVARDPEGKTLEGKTAQLFLARTLHSEYIGNRQNGKEKAEQAIAEYKKALVVDKNDQASYKAIASLYENIQNQDEWQKWVNERAGNTQIEPQFRAEALTSLAARQNTCANEVTDTEKTKKTVKKDGKDVFEFVKPESNEDFERLKVCVAEGNKLISEAVSLEPESVKSARNLNVKALSDDELKKNNDLIKIFESARSYKASLVGQAMRLAEMDGRTADRDKLKTEADQAKAQFVELSDINKSLQNEIEARIAAKLEEENANSNSDTKK